MKDTIVWVVHHNYNTSKTNYEGIESIFLSFRSARRRLRYLRKENNLKNYYYLKPWDTDICNGCNGLTPGENID